MYGWANLCDRVFFPYVGICYDPMQMWSIGESTLRMFVKYILVMSLQ